MRVTLIQPCMGRRLHEPYIRSWCMEPLAIAALGAATPPEVELRFYDDRIEPIPFDEPTDLVGISVETYTARRAYQIASEYRRRGIPVVMGGVHPTLVPKEAGRYAECVVAGEAEEIWPALLSDFRRGVLRRFYSAGRQPPPSLWRYDRRLFDGKAYMPVRLVETGRGCRGACEFCSVRAFFRGTRRERAAEDVVREVASLPPGPVFLVDDSFTAEAETAKELLRRLVPLRIRWISQASLAAAEDPELLDLAAGSGCAGLLVGLESLRPKNLRRMNKPYAVKRQNVEEALRRFRHAGIRLYATFILGYDADDERSASETLRFCLRHRFFMTGFNHLVPFPGTPLYRRLEREGHLRFARWWLDPEYTFGQLPAVPSGASPVRVERACFRARRLFYTIPSILWRASDRRANTGDRARLRDFFAVNFMLRREVLLRQDYPLGEEGWSGPLLEVSGGLRLQEGGNGKSLLAG